MYRAALVLSISAGTLVAGAVQAQSTSNYPARPIRLVIPYPPGGNTDVFGRLVGNKLSDFLGQQLVMDNRGGATGTLGADIVAKSAPDGYTLLVATFGNMIVSQALNPKLPYDPLKAFEPVAPLTSPPGLLIVHPSVPVKSVKELIAYAKANPGKLNHATPGPGSWNHLFFELFKQRTGTDIVHVPYKGMGPAIIDLVGGHMQTAIASFPSAFPHVKSGRLRPLATTGDKRSSMIPDLPTVAEAGVPKFRAAGWFAILAPAGTPKPIVAKLNAEIVKVLNLPEMVEAMRREGGEPNPLTPEETRTEMREAIAQWAPVVKSLGLRQGR